MDVSLPQASLGFLNSILTVAGGLGLIIFSTPAVVFAIVPLFIIYYRVQVMPLPCHATSCVWPLCCGRFRDELNVCHRAQGM